jgi:hypothetical protein
MSLLRELGMSPLTLMASFDRAEAIRTSVSSNSFRGKSVILLFLAGTLLGDSDP